MNVYLFVLCLKIGQPVFCLAFIFTSNFETSYEWRIHGRITFSVASLSYGGEERAPVCLSCCCFYQSHIETQRPNSLGYSARLRQLSRSLVSAPRALSWVPNESVSLMVTTWGNGVPAKWLGLKRETSEKGLVSIWRRSWFSITGNTGQWSPQVGNWIFSRHCVCQNLGGELFSVHNCKKLTPLLCKLPNLRDFLRVTQTN